MYEQVDMGLRLWEGKGGDGNKFPAMDRICVPLPLFSSCWTCLTQDSSNLVNCWCSQGVVTVVKATPNILYEKI